MKVMYVCSVCMYLMNVSNAMCVYNVMYAFNVMYVRNVMYMCKVMHVLSGVCMYIM